MPTTPPNALATSARASLAAFFAAQDHHPSPEHWAALDDVLGTLDAMAAGTAAASVFVGALDPGVGKSSAVLEFARALMASGEHRDLGMIVCVGRIEEARTMAAALDDVGRGAVSIAVLTSDPAANGMSTREPAEAQVLITTQQRVELLTEGGTFAAIEAFHYRGAVRQVRAWDEAWMPGGAVTLTGDDVGGVRGIVRRRSHECANALYAFEGYLMTLEDGAAVHVPDFEGDHAMTFLEVLMDLEAGGKPREDHKATLKALRAMNGKIARAKREGGLSNTVLTYQDTLPADLAPLLVLDASARVRTAYGFVQRHRGGLERLRDAVKDYRPLRVHLWDISGAKSGWEKHGPELVTGIVETILERPDEAWLVVHHKRPNQKATGTDDAIRRKLPKDVAARVHFVTWGNHMASNAFVEVPNVILAGTLFMKSSHYVATTNMAQGVAVAAGLAPAADVRTVTVGEHSNLILQAVCRGRVRKSDGDRCQPMNAYVIASGKSGIGDALPSIFPGCSVVTWRGPKVAKVSEKLRAALAFIDTQRAAGHQVIPNKAIRDRIRVQRQNLAKLVTGRPEWVTEMERRGLVTYGGAGKPGGVMVAPGEV